MIPQTRTPVPRWTANVICMQESPPRKQFLAYCSSPFMRLAEHLTALGSALGASTVCLDGEHPTRSVPALHGCEGLWSYEYGHACHECTHRQAVTLVSRLTFLTFFACSILGVTHGLSRSSSRSSRPSSKKSLSSDPVADADRFRPPPALATSIESLGMGFFVLSTPSPYHLHEGKSNKWTMVERGWETQGS